MRHSHWVLIGLALWGAPRAALAQDAGADAVQPLPSQHPNVEPARQTPGQVPEVGQPRLPESFAEESPGSAPGSISVRVVNAEGRPLGGVEVLIGTMREGEAGLGRSVRTDPEGTARVEGLETGTELSYRVSTEHEGARFSPQPFQLPSDVGYRAQLVRFDVDHIGRAVLLWELRFELQFKDDRLIVTERLNLTNLSGMSLGGEPPRPTTYSPREPLRFELPEGHSAFTVMPSTSDLRITEEHGAAVLRGSLPPTGSTPVELGFQYHIKLTGGDLDLRATLALPVVTASVVSEAPPGLTLSVVGMPAAEVNGTGAERVLMTGLERRPSDPQLREVNIHLGGIPAAAGVGRTAAALLSALLVVGALARALSQRTKRAIKRERAAIDAERAEVLAEARELTELLHRDEIGPVTFEKRRRELALWLASLLREQES